MPGDLVYGGDGDGYYCARAGTASADVCRCSRSKIKTLDLAARGEVVHCHAVDLCVCAPTEEEDELEEEDDDDHHSDDVDDNGSGGRRQPLVIIDDELHGPERLETMHLALGEAGLRLPTTTMKFASLTDLSLETIKLAPGVAQLLAGLVSVNCHACRSCA